MLSPNLFRRRQVRKRQAIPKRQAMIWLPWFWIAFGCQPLSSLWERFTSVFSSPTTFATLFPLHFGYLGDSSFLEPRKSVALHGPAAVHRHPASCRTEPSRPWLDPPRVGFAQKKEEKQEKDPFTTVFMPVFVSFLLSPSIFMVFRLMSKPSFSKDGFWTKADGFNSMWRLTLWNRNLAKPKKHAKPLEQSRFSHLVKIDVLEIRQTNWEGNHQPLVSNTYLLSTPQHKTPQHKIPSSVYLDI